MNNNYHNIFPSNQRGQGGRRLTREFIDRVRQCNPIEDLLRDRGIKVSPGGSKCLKCCCPMPGHADKTPSFMIYTEEQRFHCFGCSAHGDVFALYEQLYGVNFSEAVNQLARRAGLAMPSSGAPQRPATTAPRRLYDAARPVPGKPSMPGAMSYERMNMVSNNRFGADSSSDCLRTASGRFAQARRSADRVARELQPQPGQDATGALQPADKAIREVFSRILLHSMNNAYSSDFVRFLIRLFSQDVVDRVVDQYLLGSADPRMEQGRELRDIIFYQIDRLGHIRSGKVMSYDAATGKRCKAPAGRQGRYISWLHTALKQAGQLPQEWRYRGCLFGEHLLSRKENLLRPVGLVESEKTAVICSAEYPDKLWLATGGCSNLGAEAWRALRGHEVFVYPDKGSYDKWLSIINRLDREVGGVSDWAVSDFLEQQSALPDNSDLADLIIALRLSQALAREQAERQQIAQSLAQEAEARRAEEQQRQEQSSEQPGVGADGASLGAELSDGFMEESDGAKIQSESGAEQSERGSVQPDAGSAGAAGAAGAAGSGPGASATDVARGGQMVEKILTTSSPTYEPPYSGVAEELSQRSAPMATLIGELHLEVVDVRPMTSDELHLEVVDVRPMTSDEQACPF